MKKTKILLLSSLILTAMMIVISGCDKDEEDMKMTVEDIDGNIYNAVEIGTQVWMASELKTITFCDGTSIPLLTEVSDWANTDEPAYCWYNNDENLFDFALYNWYVVESDCLCPEGWHVPTDIDWDVLSEFLGGEEVAGGKLKETGTLHWKSETIIGADDYGFSAKPTRRRVDDGTFKENDGVEGGWWSSDIYSNNPNNARTRYLRHDETSLNSGNLDFKNGITVRCIQD